jgi:teichuronic acid biosynthesis glycosyltransferase TuaG
MVSIITPAWNSSAYIAETIDSVLDQTYEDWEMIVVDDFSSDSTNHIVRGYMVMDDRIRLISLEKHVGPAEARNTAIRAARGRYIAFLDSDDLWHPQKLERQLDFMQFHGYAFSFTNYQRIKGTRATRMNVIRVPRKIGYSAYLKNTIIGALTVILDREKTGDFKMPDIRSSHDMALWCEILKRGFKAYGLRETMAYYRVMPGSNTSQKLKAARDVWKVYREIEHLKLLPSSVNFVFYACNALRKRIW